jgi:glycosyltransferase involved in cell wall biosynthesis
MRLLILTPQLPFPALQGAAIRNSHLIRELAARHHVSLLTFASGDMPPGDWRAPHLPPLPGAEGLARLRLVAPPTRSFSARLRTLLGSDLPDMARRLESAEMRDALHALLTADSFDWVITEGIEMAQYNPRGRARWLFDEHNAEYLLQQRAFLNDLRRAHAPGAAAGALYSLAQWRRLRRYEGAACRAADAVTAVSPADQAALLRLSPGLTVDVVPNGVDLDAWDRAAAGRDAEVEALRAAGPLVVFDGSMDFRPNVDAARWFCEACWPRIRAARPDATFAIVGRRPTRDVQALAALPGVRVTGEVPDPRPWVAGADVYVVPMRVGGGVRLKFLQALAMGAAVVSTTLGAEGVDTQAGRDLLVADDAAGFAAATLALLADPGRRASLGAAARAAVAPYAWHRVAPLFEAALERGAAAERDGRLARATAPVSVIMTVRNEAGSLPGVLASLAAQSRPPDEVVIADGGSTDGTLDLLRRAAPAAPWPLRIIAAPGANISRGRNLAISAAAHEIIAATDAGVRLPPGWLAALVAPFAAPGGDPVDVVSGFFAPDPRTVFERALGATALPAPADVRPDRFLPSSRSVAFRKAAWGAVGGYPEWLDYSEDLVFDMALKAAGARFVFAPRAVALFRPRGALGAFFRQYYLYARGDGKADLWRKRHAIRYTTYILGPVLAGLARRRPPIAGALAVGALAYCAGPYRRLRPWLRGLGWADRARAALLVPVIRVTGDLGKMAGYPVGVRWRLRHRKERTTP